MGAFTVFTFLYFHVDMVILSILKGSHDTGIYGAAYKIVEVALVFPGIVGGVLLPVFTRLVQQDRTRLVRSFRYACKVMVGIGAMAALVLGVAAKDIIQLIAGTAFHAAVPVLQILAAAVFFSFVSGIIDTLVLALGRQKDLIGFLVGITVLNMSLNFLLIPRYGYMASAWLTLMCEILITAYPLLILREEVRPACLTD
jgi:O-antigen/teichoic acid export membrane protein